VKGTVLSADSSITTTHEGPDALVWAVERSSTGFFSTPPRDEGPSTPAMLRLHFPCASMSGSRAR
jgi:hypothetical protein